MKKRLLYLTALIVFAFLFSLAVTSIAAEKTRLKTVDEKGTFPTGIKKVGVVEWSTQGSDIRYTYPQKLNWPRLMADSIQANLSGNYETVKIYVSKKEAEADGADLIISGRYIFINQGSRGARMWVGYGAGSAGVRIEGEISSKQGLVATFQSGRSSASSMEGVAAIQHCISSLGYDISSYVLSHK